MNAPRTFLANAAVLVTGGFLKLVDGAEKVVDIFIGVRFRFLDTRKRCDINVGQESIGINSRRIPGRLVLRCGCVQALVHGTRTSAALTTHTLLHRSWISLRVRH